MRLNQFLASAGLGSRRSCEELIRTGQVKVNGAVCANLATTVQPTDIVKVGSRVLHSAAPVTVLLHKPPGFLCSASDPHARRTIFDLLPPNYPRLFHVGRLDRESEGLILLTNDGTLSLKLTHPRYKVEKEYEVVLNKAFDFELVSKLLHGMSLEEGWAKAESVHRLAANKLKVILRQGMKRQIRLMFYELGYEVVKLVRVRIGPIEIGTMPPGSWRVLPQKEIDALLAAGAQSAQSEETPRAPRRAPKRPSPRPHQRPAPNRDRAGERPRHPREKRPEEIPFVPRARREQEKPVEKARRPLSGRKPFANKPAGSKKSSAKPAGKPAPRPFAKFERRRFDH